MMRIPQEYAGGCNTLTRYGPTCTTRSVGGSIPSGRTFVSEMRVRVLQKLRFDSYLTATVFGAALSELARHCPSPAAILPPANARRLPSWFWRNCAQQVEIPVISPSAPVLNQLMKPEP